VQNRGGYGGGQFFFAELDRVVLSYSNFFGRGTDRDDEEGVGADGQVEEISEAEANGEVEVKDREDYLSHWGWLMTAYRIAGDDFTKMEQVFSMTAIEFLNYCSMRKDIQNQTMADLKRKSRGIPGL
jgi:hypothetical protein